jgi:hypothetical protein
MRTIATRVLSCLVLAAALPVAGCYAEVDPAPATVYYGGPAYRPAPPPPQGYYHYYYRGSVVVR